MKIDWSEPGLPLSATAHAVVLVANSHRALLGSALRRCGRNPSGRDHHGRTVQRHDEGRAHREGGSADAEASHRQGRRDRADKADARRGSGGRSDAARAGARNFRRDERAALAADAPAGPRQARAKPEPQKAAEPQKPEPPKLDAEIPKPPEKPQPPKVVKTQEPPKEVEKPKPQPPQFDKIAQLLEQKKLEDPQKPAKPPAKEKAEPNFSTSAIEKLLISKEKPQASGSIGAQLQKTASLGTPTGDAPKLSPSMRDALAGLLKDQVQKCFDIPPGMDESKIQQAQVRVVFNQDGSLAGRPLVASSSSDPGVRAVAGALQRAIMRCAPYRIPAQFLPTFNDWKDTLFTPPELVGMRFTRHSRAASPR